VGSIELFTGICAQAGTHRKAKTNNRNMPYLVMRRKLHKIWPYVGGFHFAIEWPIACLALFSGCRIV
jgi:hypothetical protein